ncbi:hypothetical protein VPHD148_0280 [Vibrio phage D148]
MARLNVLEYKADFIRGWPHGEAVEMNYPTVGSDVLGNGDIVAVVAGGVQKAVGAAGEVLGMIARGKGDTFEAGGTGRNNLYSQVVPNIVLLSNFVVRTSNIDAAGLTVGQPAYVDATGALTATDSTTTSEVFGTVMEVETDLKDADGNDLPHVAVILVK